MEEQPKKRPLTNAEKQRRYREKHNPNKPLNSGRQKCYSCAMPLRTFAERMIGVHIGCVAESKFNKVTIPRPKYGNQQGESQRKAGPRIY